MKKAQPTRFGLEISSFVWCGSLGAEHYYGEIWWEISTAKYGYEKEKLTQPLTAKNAAYLNKKDSSTGFALYEKGEPTERFDTQDQVRKRAIKVLTERFGTDITIEEGSRCYDTEDNKILYPKSV